MGAGAAVHVRSHDWALLLLVGASLAAVAAFLGAGPGAPGQGTGGWRRVDAEAVRLRIEAGDLSSREALWWHAEDGRRPGASRGDGGSP
jgi:hypothetical protein